MRGNIESAYISHKTSTPLREHFDLRGEGLSSNFIDSTQSTESPLKDR
jgi:hypothetical protein